MSEEQTLFADIRAYFLSQHLHDIEKIVVDLGFYGKICERVTRDFPNFFPGRNISIMGIPIKVGYDPDVSGHKITIYTKQRKLKND